MDIWQTDKLVLFLAFVIPGFISIKCYQLAFPGTARPSSEQLVDAIAYSCINYAVLAVPIVLIERSTLSQSSSFRSEEHTSELQSRENLVCRLLLEKKKK